MKINKHCINTEDDKESTTYYYEANEPNIMGDLKSEISSKILEPQDNLKKSSLRHFLKPDHRLSSNLEGNIDNLFQNSEKKELQKNNLNECDEIKSLTENNKNRTHKIYPEDNANNSQEKKTDNNTLYVLKEENDINAINELEKQNSNDKNNNNISIKKNNVEYNEKNN